MHLIRLPQIEHQPCRWVKHFIGGMFNLYWIKTPLSLTDNYSKYRSNKAQHPKGKRGHLTVYHNKSATPKPPSITKGEKKTDFVDKSKIEFQWLLKEMILLRNYKSWREKNTISQSGKCQMALMWQQTTVEDLTSLLTVRMDLPAGIFHYEAARLVRFAHQWKVSMWEFELMEESCLIGSGLLNWFHQCQSAICFDCGRTDLLVSNILTLSIFTYKQAW